MAGEPVLLLASLPAARPRGQIAVVAARSPSVAPLTVRPSAVRQTDAIRQLVSPLGPLLPPWLADDGLPEPALQTAQLAELLPELRNAAVLRRLRPSPQTSLRRPRPAVLLLDVARLDAKVRRLVPYELDTASLPVARP